MADHAVDRHRSPKSDRLWSEIADAAGSFRPVCGVREGLSHNSGMHSRLDIFKLASADR